tara:strand:- start:334 stop:570 length:237 start_codon:yes stop_codon:yes gene_type:complete
MTDVTENEVQTISFNDKEYRSDEISDKAKYIISQIQDLNGQSNQLKAKLDQVDVASQGFTSLLGAELEAPKVEEGEVL